MTDYSDISFRHLQYFKAVVDCGTLNGAAELLHVSPAAMSQRIAQFEEIIGLPLFERRKQRLVLTPAGRKLYGDFESITMLLYRALDDAHHRFDPSRAITIGFSSYQGSELTRVIMDDFRRIFPDFDFAVELHQRIHLIDEFLGRKIDILAVTDFEGLSNMPGIYCLEVAPVPIACYVNADSELGRRSTFDWKCLNGMTCVLPEHQRGRSLVRDLTKELTRSGVHMNIEFHAGDIMTVKGLVENNENIVTVAGLPKKRMDGMTLFRLPQLTYPYILTCFSDVLEINPQIRNYMETLRMLISRSIGFLTEPGDNEPLR